MATARITTDRGARRLRPDDGQSGPPVASGVQTTVQTTLVAGSGWVLDWMADFCLRHVRRLSILPFIPRGSGNNRRGEYEL